MNNIQLYDLIKDNLHDYQDNCQVQYLSNWNQISETVYFFSYLLDEKYVMKGHQTDIGSYS